MVRSFSQTALGSTLAIALKVLAAAPVEAPVQEGPVQALVGPLRAAVGRDPPRLPVKDPRQRK